MKTKFFLGMGLMLTTVGFGQTSTVVPANTNDTFNNVLLGVSTNTAAPSSEAIKFNVYAGFKAGENSIGGKNVFTGHSAGQNNNGDFNVFSGYFSGLNNAASRNVFIGNATGQSNVQGASNVFIGDQAGKGNVRGHRNVYIGANAGFSNNDTIGNASNNIFIGEHSGSESTTASSNIFIGRMAGKKNNGIGNVFIGHGAGINEVLGSNKLIIGTQTTSTLTTQVPLIYGEFDNDIIKFNAKKVGIGYEGAPGEEQFGNFPALTGLTNVNKYRLFVRGGILAEEVRIRLHEDWIWPDYVFTKDYKLLSLKETEKFISQNGHLPNMPSAEKVKAEGIEMGNIVTLQQEKIEELTLHLIEQQKQIEELKAQVQLLLNK